MLILFRRQGVGYNEKNGGDYANYVVSFAAQTLARGKRVVESQMSSKMHVLHPQCTKWAFLLCMVLMKVAEGSGGTILTSLFGQVQLVRHTPQGSKVDCALIKGSEGCADNIAEDERLFRGAETKWKANQGTNS